MLTAKQEAFALYLFQDTPEIDAYREAGYSVAGRSIDAVYVDACRLAANPKIVLRLQELRQPAVNSTKMLVIEREERLSDIAREDITSAKGTPLRVPNISAIQELNKMDKLYSDSPPGFQDNSKNIYFILNGDQSLIDGIGKRLNNSIKGGDDAVE
ncbi:hypothetical protein LCGC14_2941370 [marine sediment metagenome]|uniref:Terminase small subunit n=1 Tax=marine sediment metagenome TaxID=412755 RepID=A0A0F8ZQL8_9ZZZZ